MALSDVHWKGLTSIEAMCDLLPGRIAKARLDQAYKYALEPTKFSMQNNIKQRTGRLFHSIDTTVIGKQDMEQMYAIVGPRRKRFTWNQQGWHAHLVESGVKPHIITAGYKSGMPIFNGKVLAGFAKVIEHKGYAGKKPFKRAIDSTWQRVGERIGDKVAEIMDKEIKIIANQK